jgi:hypothetical protein
MVEQAAKKKDSTEKHTNASSQNYQRQKNVLSEISGSVLCSLDEVNCFF